MIGAEFGPAMQSRRLGRTWHVSVARPSGRHRWDRDDIGCVDVPSPTDVCVTPGLRLVWRLTTENTIGPSSPGRSSRAGDWRSNEYRGNDCSARLPKA